MAEQKNETLEIYKLAVEMSDRTTARRGAANALFVTLNAGVVTASAALKGADAWAGPVAGLALCLTWWMLLASYRRLSTAKFEVVHALEAKLAEQPFKDEWDIVQRKSSKYVDQGVVERLIPFAFSLLYVALFFR